MTTAVDGSPAPRREPVRGQTGLVDRINAVVLRRVRPIAAGDASAIAADAEWLVRLVAVLHAGPVGDSAMLVAELVAGGMLVTHDEDPGWPALLDVLDRSGRTWCSSREWMLRLVAAGPGRPLVLIGAVA